MHERFSTSVPLIPDATKRKHLKTTKVVDFFFMFYLENAFRLLLWGGIDLDFIGPFFNLFHPLFFQKNDCSDGCDPIYTQKKSTLSLPYLPYVCKMEGMG